MRFSWDKVHAISEKIVDMLENDGEVTIHTSPREMESAVAGAINADLLEEDEIDAEVEGMLEQYRSEIDRGGMDVELIRRRFKDQIAKKRGFVV